MVTLDRHAALADPTRRALLGALRRSREPADVRALASEVGLHPNSAREQLARLAEAGLVRIDTSAPAGRGRPGLRYQAVPEATVEPFRVLASTLADGLADLPDGVERSVAAGERWGREAAVTLPSTTPGQALGSVVRLLDEAGFQPEVIDGPGSGAPSLRLHACPFLPLDDRRLAIVCNVHLGFLRGALGELGAPLDAATIHPFDPPGACTAHLETRPDA